MEIRKISESNSKSIILRQVDFDNSENSNIIKIKDASKSKESSIKNKSDKSLAFETSNNASFVKNKIEKLYEELIAKPETNNINSENIVDLSIPNKINSNNIEELIKQTISAINEEKPTQKLQNVTHNQKNNNKNEQNIHKDHRKRLKNQFLENGLESMTDIQKLELLLFFAIPQKDTNPIAHRLLDKFGSLKKVFLADYNKLIEVSGVKENSAILIKLLASLHKVINLPSEIHSIEGVSEAKQFCNRLFVGVDVEQFYVICLSKNNSILKYKMIQSGSTDEVYLQIRSITQFAIDNKCSRIIVCHNHPTGLAVMSDEDASFTYNLLCSCLLNSIEIVDHIIVGMDKTISLASQQHLQKLRQSAFKALNIPQQNQVSVSSDSAEYKIDE